MRFADRRDAGRRLAEVLAGQPPADPVVLGLPRGGVVVAAEVARVLQAPLDVIVVRKLGMPWQPELAMGAIGEGGARVLDAHAGRVSARELADVERKERAELERRVALLRRGRPMTPIAGRAVILVDDGVATGSTARAAAQVARALGAGEVVLAVPVAPAGFHADFADRFVVLDQPAEFFAVGQFYRDFGQVSDAEVIELLNGS